MTATLFSNLLVIAAAPVVECDRCPLCGLLPDFCPCDSRELFTLPAPAPSIETEVSGRETEWTVAGSNVFACFDGRSDVYLLSNGVQALNVRRADLETISALAAHALAETAPQGQRCLDCGETLTGGECLPCTAEDPGYKVTRLY